VIVSFKEFKALMSDYCRWTYPNESDPSKWHNAYDGYIYRNGYREFPSGSRALEIVGSIWPDFGDMTKGQLLGYVEFLSNGVNTRLDALIQDPNVPTQAICKAAIFAGKQLARMKWFGETFKDSFGRMVEHKIVNGWFHGTHLEFVRAACAVADRWEDFETFDAPMTAVDYRNALRIAIQNNSIQFAEQVIKCMTKLKMHDVILSVLGLFANGSKDPDIVALVVKSLTESHNHMASTLCPILSGYFEHVKDLRVWQVAPYLVVQSLFNMVNASPSDPKKRRQMLGFLIKLPKAALSRSGNYLIGGIFAGDIAVIKMLIDAGARTPSGNEIRETARFHPPVRKRKILELFGLTD